MSIDQKELKIHLKTKRHRRLVGGLLALEFVLSVVLCVSLAAQIIWPNVSGASGSVGTPLQLNYEGYLTDSANNPLGGASGTEYCFHFSIYDSISGGNKLWPSVATPSVTAATATNGVFTAAVGQADAFASTTFDFSTTSNAYLQVEVNTTTGPTCTSSGSYQTLTPRQQILASGYSLASNNVSGQLLDTNEAPTGSSTVQVGLGAGGSGNPVYLGLDIKNTVGSGDYVGNSCQVNGLMWYNSATSHILVCLGGFVQALDNAGSTSTIAAIVTPFNLQTASSGSIYFSNANNMSFGLNGNTLTASGIGNAQLSQYANAEQFVGTQTFSISSNTSIIFPFTLPNPMNASFLRFPITVSAGASSYATTGNSSWTGGMFQTYNAVLYSLGTGVNSLSLRFVASGSIQFAQAYTYTANANSSQYSVTEQLTYPSGSGNSSSFTTTYATTLSNVSLNAVSLSNFTGARFLDIPFNTLLSGGNYWMAIGVSSTNITQYTNKFSNNGIFATNIGISQVTNGYNLWGSATNATYNIEIGNGSFTAAAPGTTASIPLTGISTSASQLQPYFQIIRIT